MGTTWARALVAALTTALVASVLGLAPPPSASAEGDLTVTWPTVTQFNPDLTEYVVEATYSGGANVFVWTVAWDGNSTWDLLDRDGTHTVRFPAGGWNGSTSVRLLACPTSTFSTSCPELARSPQLTVYAAAHPSLPQVDYDSSQLGPTESVATITWPLDMQWDFDWEIGPADDPAAPPLVSGSAAAVPSDHGLLPPVGPSDALVSGEAYVYRVHVSGDSSLYGHLEGDARTTFVWDAHAPELGLAVGHSSGDPDYATINDDVFYPVKDGYRDAALAQGWADDEYEIRTATFVVTDATGAQVFRREADADDPDMAWPGRDNQGDLLPEGQYTVTLVAADMNDNASSVSRSIDLSYAHKRVELWRRTVPAAQTVVQRATRGCGQLIAPARRAWQGSLAYAVKTPCRQTTVVATSNGLYVPRSPIGEYSGMRITVHGTKGLGEKHAELTLYYLDQDGDWVARRRLDGDGNRHPGAWLGRHKGVLGKPRERPHVIWSVGLSKGWRYDVKSFTAEVKWVDFR